MSWLNFFFSFRGRINRARYWAFVGIVLLAVAFIAIVIWAVATSGSEMADTIVGSIIVVTTLPYLISSFAIQTKRLHDRDKSAWWLVWFYFLPAALAGFVEAMVGDEAIAALVGLLPLPMYIWGFVETGCLKGTDGPNRYGADPLDGTEAVAKTFD